MAQSIIVTPSSPLMIASSTAEYDSIVCQQGGQIIITTDCTLTVKSMSAESGTGYIVANGSPGEHGPAGAPGGEGAWGGPGGRGGNGGNGPTVNINVRQLSGSWTVSSVGGDGGTGGTGGPGGSPNGQGGPGGPGGNGGGGGQIAFVYGVAAGVRASVTGDVSGGRFGEGGTGGTGNGSGGNGSDGSPGSPGPFGTFEQTEIPAGS